MGPAGIASRLQYYAAQRKLQASGFREGESGSISPAQHRAEELLAAPLETTAFPPPHITLFFPSSQRLQCACLNLFRIFDVNWLWLMTSECGIPYPYSLDLPGSWN